MRKYPLFVLAAAAAMSIASVPMTAHAAAFQVTGGGNGHEWLYDKLQRADRQFGRHIQSV